MGKVVSIPRSYCYSLNAICAPLSRLAPFVAALIVLALVQVVINHVLYRSRRAAVAIQPAISTEDCTTDPTSGHSARVIEAAPATQNPPASAGLDPNAPLLTWDPASGTWKAQRLGDYQPAAPADQGGTYTNGYSNTQLSPIVVGYQPPDAAAGSPSPDPLIVYQPPDAAAGSFSPDPLGQRRHALEQQIAALEAQIERDARRVSGLGILGQGFDKVPDVMHAKPPEGRGEALAGAVAEVLAGALSKQAGQERAEAQARIDANRLSLQQLRGELADLGR